VGLYFMSDFWSTHQDARFLITGASGWFGRTLVDQLIRADVPFLCLGSKSRKEVFSGKLVDVYSYADASRLSFNPTFIADFAFLTRDKSAVMTAQAYANINRMLTDQALSLARMSSVRAILTTSSGASVHGSPDLYSRLKLEADNRFRDEAAKLDKSWVNIRAWSVSGPFIRNIEGYAFSKFVNDAIFTGKISIDSPHLVFRRYVDVGDLISVATQLALKGKFIGTIDSGGELVELEQLAHRIFGIIQREPNINVCRGGVGVVDDYFSRSAQWENSCRKVGYTPKGLDDQILQLSRRLLEDYGA
jgi:nucleoside-diphosphate-sugar epimerase